MAENAPAADAGTPTPHQRPHRKPLPCKETAAAPPACPTPKKKSKTDIAIEEAATRLAAQAPPLSPEQRRRIAELFSGVINRRR